MIERSVIDQQYKNVSEFVDNINLVFTNCYDYNGPINGKNNMVLIIIIGDIHMVRDWLIRSYHSVFINFPFL